MRSVFLFILKIEIPPPRGQLFSCLVVDGSRKRPSMMVYSGFLFRISDLEISAFLLYFKNTITAFVKCGVD